MNQHFPQIIKDIKKPQIQEVQRTVNKTNVKKKERKKRVNSLYIIVGEIRRRQWHPTPVLLAGKSHGWRSLVGCSPLGR